MTPTADGYYWFRCEADGRSMFVAKLDRGQWYLAGMREPVRLTRVQCIAPVEKPGEATKRVAFAMQRALAEREVMIPMRLLEAAAQAAFDEARRDG